LTNLGTSSDTFDFEINGNTWETTVTFPESTLPPGESTEVMVTVTIPTNSTPGDIESVDITFTSQGDPDKFALANLITWVDYPIFFPLIRP
jgi:uncharacterized membrane protein